MNLAIKENHNTDNLHRIINSNEKIIAKLEILIKLNIETQSLIKELKMSREVKHPTSENLIEQTLAKLKIPEGYKK